MTSKIFLSLTMSFIAIIVLNNMLFLQSLTNTSAQLSDVYVNNTVTTMDTNIMNSGNQIQMAKINSCLNKMNPGMMTVYAYSNIVGSIKIKPILNDTISKIKINLSHATDIAEKEIDNNSHATEAYLCDANGYLVYMIWVRGINSEMIDIVVDPGNGRILLKNSNLLSQQNSMNNHTTLQGLYTINH